MAAILYTLLFLLGGMMIIRMQLPGKSPLTRVFLGLALGVLLEMVLPALCANVWGFTLIAHGAAAALLLLLVGVSARLRDDRPVRGMTQEDKQMLAAMAAVVLPLTALSAYLQYTHMLMPAADGSAWCG